jgi:hypothetical protein
MNAFQVGLGVANGTMELQFPSHTDELLLNIAKLAMVRNPEERCSFATISKMLNDTASKQLS